MELYKLFQSPLLYKGEGHYKKVSLAFIYMYVHYSNGTCRNLRIILC